MTAMSTSPSTTQRPFCSGYIDNDVSLEHAHRSAHMAVMKCKIGSHPTHTLSLIVAEELEW